MFNRKYKLNQYLVVALLFCCSGMVMGDGAPSIWYGPTNDSFTGDIIIRTVQIPYDTMYTYYSTINWNAGMDGGGYCGLQAHPDGHNYIFSIWDPSNGQPITAAYQDPGTEVLPFGGEGTGLKSWNFQLGWTNGQWYSTATRCWDVGDHTHFGYWVHDITGDKWTHLVTMDFPMPSIRFSTGNGGFLEDWAGTGQNIRRYHITSSYKRSTSGSWTGMQQCYIAANADTGGQYDWNFDGGVESDYYFVESGGSSTPGPAFGSGRSATFSIAKPTTPQDPAIEFTISNLTTSSISWNVPQSSTPQFKYTIKVNSVQVASAIAPETRVTSISASGGDTVELTLEDILGLTASKSQVIASGGDMTAPTPDPMTWAALPYATGARSISMTATTASDPSGVEYYFTCTAGGGNDSGWQDSTIYEDTGLAPSTSYTYIVTARDKAVNQNSTGASTAESETTDDPLPIIPQSGWTLHYVDSEETSAEDGAAVNAFDGDTATIWHTEWSASSPSHPHEIQINLGGNYDIGEFRYLPRQTSANGRIANYEFYVSTDGSSWGSAVVTGTFANTADEQEVFFDNANASYVRLVALSEVNGNPWTSAAEINVYGTSAGEDTTPPTPDPMTWATVPYATGAASISMTATTASDPSGVQYYFMCTAGSGNDSGWQDSPTYEDTGLSPDTTYTYQVKASDISPNMNETGWSTAESATTNAQQDTTPPTPDPMTWATLPYATGTNSISMTATTASDPSGVEYYFTCTAGGGNDSGWQDSTTYEDTGLSPDTTYTYTVTARDKSANQNETAASTTESATTDPASGPTIVFTDNFESATDWSTEWIAYGAWARKTARPHDGSYSAEIDGVVTDSALVSRSIDVTGKSTATITFWWFIERGLDSGEYLAFDTDTGSGWVQKADRQGNVDTENVWANESIVVDVSGTNTLTIRFRGKMNKSNEDAYVDQVEVSAE